MYLYLTLSIEIQKKKKKKINLGGGVDPHVIENWFFFKNLIRDTSRINIFIKDSRKYLRSMLNLKVCVCVSIIDSC